MISKVICIPPKLNPTGADQQKNSQPLKILKTLRKRRIHPLVRRTTVKYRCSHLRGMSERGCFNRLWFQQRNPEKLQLSSSSGHSKPSSPNIVTWVLYLHAISQFSVPLSNYQCHKSNYTAQCKTHKSLTSVILLVKCNQDVTVHQKLLVSLTEKLGPVNRKLKIW